jgi:riboflavin kinase
MNVVLCTGFPTANFSEEVIERLPSELVGGIYWGLAAVDRGPVHGMVMSIGWNPFYKDEKRAMETHILHHFQEDLYGRHLK